MDEQKLIDLISRKFTQREIAVELEVGQSTVRWWLKKYGLQTIRGPKGKLPKDYQKPRRCNCGEIDPTKFYGNKSQVCAKCHSNYTLERGRKQQQKAIDYLGGKCQDCGYKACVTALDIHHLDSSLKDSNFKTHRYWSWERLLKELESCVLVCRNCHAERHCNGCVFHRDVG